MVYGHNMTETASRSRNRLDLAGRALAALVWLHQGLWCKVLRGDRRHQDVVASLPGLTGQCARSVTTGIGLAETALAGLVVLRGDRRWVAGVQTGVLAAFNAGGLALGRRHIPHPGRLLLRNGAFVALIWISSREHRPR
jgi:hypothetical protein